MIRILLTSLFLILYSSVILHAQDFPNLISPTKVTTIGYWNNGQSTRYHVKQKNSSFKGKSEKPFKESTVEYDIHLKVTDSTETSYTFEMRYSNYHLDDETSGFMKKIAELPANVPVIYQTNELGQFDTILNLEALQLDLIEKLNASKEILAEETEEKELIELYQLVMDNMVEKFKKTENIEALFLEDIYLIHGFYGFEMQVGKPIDIELDYATIGNFMLTGTGTLTLNTISKPKDECIFSTSEKPNREELAGYMESLALLFMLDSKKKFSLEDLNISMNTKKKLKMELSTGWMNSVINTSTIKLTNKKGEQKKVNVTEIVRQ